MGAAIDAGSERVRAGRRVIEHLRSEGYEALFAGGYVRDLLLDRVGPDTDADVATDATPDEVEAAFERTIPVGKQFGVVVVVDRGTPVEVATFRTDGPYRDGRRPSSVGRATKEEDAERRDFTVNGMFLDPVSGEVLDFVGGQADLERQVIRAIGDPRARFAEDRLRLLRAVRFAARLGFSLDPATADAVAAMAPAITEVSRERVGEEIVKILREGGAARGLALLDELGLLAVVLPEVAAMHGVEQGVEHHPEGDVFVHTTRVLAALDGLPAEERTETLALGALLHDVAKPVTAGRREDGRIHFHGHCERGAEMARDLGERLRRSNATLERVAFLVAQHLRLLDAPAMRPSTLKRFLRQDGIEELLRLARLDALGSNGDLRWVTFCREALASLDAETMRPAPLLSGRDLIELGFPPGPRFREILDAVEEAQLEDRLADRDAALAFVREHFAVSA